MKTTMFLLSVFLILSFPVRGQNGQNVPEAVKTAFAKQFPNATNIKWSKENDREWEAEFKTDGKAYSANFNSEGKWLETEYKISSNEIPATVLSAIAKEFAGYKTEESEVSETAKGKVYEFILSKGEEKIEAAFRPDGNLLSKKLITKTAH